MSSWWVCTTEWLRGGYFGRVCTIEDDTRGTSPLLCFGLDETFWVRNVEFETLVVKKNKYSYEHLFKR